MITLTVSLLLHVNKEKCISRRITPTQPYPATINISQRGWHVLNYLKCVINRSVIGHLVHGGQEEQWQRSAYNGLYIATPDCGQTGIKQLPSSPSSLYSNLPPCVYIRFAFSAVCCYHVPQLKSFPVLLIAVQFASMLLGKL